MKNSQKELKRVKKTNERLQKIASLFKKRWEDAPVACHTLNTEGIITDVNKTEARMLGYKKEEMIGHPIFDFILPDQREEARKRFLQKLKGRRLPRAKDRIYLRKDGSKIYVAIDDRLERDRSGKVISVHTTMVDISDHKKAEAALKDSEARYKELVEMAGIGILIDDEQGNVKYANKRYAEIFGYNLREFRRLSIQSVVHPDDVEKVMKYHLGRIKGKRVPSRYEFKGIRKDGTPIYLEVSAVPLKEDGEIIGTRAYLWDITERKKAEKEIKDTLEMLRKNLNATINAIALTVEARDPFTSGHQRRVADLARAIATEMGLTKDSIEAIRTAGVIHDLGKICVPADILSKPAKLNELEFSLIKAHPKVAYDILKEIDFPWPVAEIVYQHHERWNGSGYPRGLSDDEILLEARILAVADVVEAMSSHRPYRPALGIKEALKEIEKNKGILYDLETVNVCLKLFSKKKYSFK